ncbi:26S proteasome regulatory subunit RPN11 [Aphelenchoides bicaudatus]|nr:26S proteasome regulatory subunit RPN11 [Aphelenchoides bicaudatus]
MNNLDQFKALLAGVSSSTKSGDSKKVDTSETVYISSLALLKMLKHGRAGVPMEVMGLMLGEFVDDYTRLLILFSKPKMLDMLKQTGRFETVVGWYHSHPGFGCWLSSVDVTTQQSFEALSSRAVAVVIDPIQSVKGKVVIDAFRSINLITALLGQEPRQITSNIGHLQKPSIQALIHGLNLRYYSIPIAYSAHSAEQKMLLSLNRQSWNNSLVPVNFREHCNKNESTIKEMLKLVKLYNKALEEEENMTKSQLTIKNVGKLDPKRELSEIVSKLLADTLCQSLVCMIDAASFK